MDLSSRLEVSDRFRYGFSTGDLSNIRQVSKYLAVFQVDVSIAGRIEIPEFGFIRLTSFR